MTKIYIYYFLQFHSILCVYFFSSHKISPINERKRHGGNEKTKRKQEIDRKLSISFHIRGIIYNSHATVLTSPLIRYREPFSEPDALVEAIEAR